MVGGDSDFDKWLEHELQNRAAAHMGPRPMPVQAEYHAAFLKQANRVPVFAKVAALLSAKVVVGLTLGVLAVSAASAGEAAITGSANPTAWGQQVVQQVEKCKDALTPGAHGIGDCVSTFASQRGVQVSTDQHASGARTNEPSPTDPSKGKSKNQGSGNGNGNGNGQGNGGGNGNSQGNGNGGGQGDGHGNGGGGNGGSGNGGGNGNGGGGNGHGGGGGNGK